jgi:hypothetical protein
VVDDAKVEQTPPGAALAQSFDSAEATQRLAALTSTASQPQTATQVMKSIPRPPPSVAWRRRDWALVGTAVVLGLVIAFLKLLR